jgi:hypothetical protein
LGTSAHHAFLLAIKHVLQVEGLFQNCAAQIQNLASLRKQIVTAMNQNAVMNSYLPVVKILTKHTLAFGKYFRRTQQLSQQRFAQLPMCGDLILFYWSQIVEASSSPENAIAGQLKSPGWILLSFLFIF